MLTSSIFHKNLRVCVTYFILQKFPRIQNQDLVVASGVNSSNCSEDVYYFGQITFVGYRSFFNLSVERINFSWFLNKLYSKNNIE